MDKLRKDCLHQAIYTHYATLSPEHTIHTDSTHEWVRLCTMIKNRERRRRCINHPCNASTSSPLFLDSKLRSLKSQTGNVLKNVFRNWPFYRPKSIPTIFNITPIHTQTGLSVQRYAKFPKPPNISGKKCIS